MTEDLKIQEKDEHRLATVLGKQIDGLDSPNRQFLVLTTMMHFLMMVSSLY